MKPTRWTVALYMALVFLCGAVVGAFAFRLYTVSGVSANVNQRNPEEFRKRYLTELKERLQLDADQASRITGIMDETRMRFEAARDRIEPEIRKIREDQREKIGALLTPAQRVEWQKMEDERRERRGKRGGRGPGGFRQFGEPGRPPSPPAR